MQLVWGIHVRYDKGIWKQSSFSKARPSVNTNPSRKRSFSKTLFKPEEFENPGFELLFIVDGEHFLKRELFGNDAIKIIIWFPWPSFSRTQILGDRRLLCFLISRVYPACAKNILCVFRVKTPFSSSSGVWAREAFGSWKSSDNHGVTEQLLIKDLSPCQLVHSD